MAPKKIIEVKINPLPDKTSIRSIRLDFLFSRESEPISVELYAKMAEHVGDAILQVLRSGNNRTPPIPRPSGGKPKLRIVK
jgi:hypothetical protein